MTARAPWRAARRSLATVHATRHNHAAGPSVRPPGAAPETVASSSPGATRSDSRATPRVGCGCNADSASTSMEGSRADRWRPAGMAKRRDGRHCPSGGAGLSAADVAAGTVPGAGRARRAPCPAGAASRSDHNRVGPDSRGEAGRRALISLSGAEGIATTEAKELGQRGSRLPLRAGWLREQQRRRRSCRGDKEASRGARRASRSAHNAGPSRSQTRCSL
jgi:hypothetical protein